MIRYVIAGEELRKWIEAEDPNWFAKVNDVLARLPPNPTSKQFESLWSDIKQVYIRLQHSKCIYCESLLEGAISNDVEHFRPKAGVSSWKVPAWLAEQTLVTTPHSKPKGDAGYRELAYEPWNYAASCKVCNSVLKKNYFPILGARDSSGTDPRKMRGEKALLIYPIGDVDRFRPEELIRFVGMHPEAVRAKGTTGYFQALVTIEMFRLDDAVRRKELFRARATYLRVIYKELETSRTSPSRTERDDADEWIQLLVDGNSPHANCMRCFRELYHSGRDESRAIIDDAKRFLQTGSLAAAPP